MWQYINRMQIHFKEVNKTTPQINILRLIHDQLRQDTRFKTATDHLQERISKYKSGNGFVPPEYRLNKIARTIMDQYDAREREKLSEPRKRTVHALNLSINKMATRDSSRSQESNDTFAKPLSSYGKSELRTRYQRNATDVPGNETEEHKMVRFQKPPPNDIHCKGCITYGHPVEECTKTGAAISIAQFLRTCPPEKKRQILEEAHERYINAYKRRRKLKQQIKSIKYDHQFDEVTERWKNLTVPELQNIEQLKVACVIAAKEQHPDLDFGSLDAN